MGMITGKDGRPRNHNLLNAMPDDPSKTGKEDDQRINVNQDYELDYWSRTLGVSKDRLREVVKKVGPMVKDVRRELGK